jgi:hypothetical protein
LSAVLLLALPGAAHAESRFSLSIGNNLGHGEDEPLRWAERDAERFDALAGQLGGVTEDRRIRLLGEGIGPLRLALARVRGRIEEARRNGERTLLLVYYSGHGDESALRLAGERLPLAELQRMLREVPATATVVILDACHSGSLVRGRSKGLGRGPAFDVSLVRQTGPEGRVVIASAGAHEVAQESDALQGSYFTHHLVSGLRGAADTDADGRVSLAEAYRYVYHRTLTTSHGSTAAVQHPELMSQLAGEGDLFLSFLERSQSRLELPEGLKGSVMVVEERTQQVVAEVEPGGASPVHLALPSGRYRVQVRRGTEVLYGNVYLPWGERRKLALEELEVRTLAQHQRKGALLAPVDWRWGLGAGLSRSHTSAGGWGPGAALLLERQSQGQLALGAQLGLAANQRRGRYLGFRSVELEALGSAGVLRPLGALRAGVHAALGLVGVYQHSVHHEAQRVLEQTGFNPVYDNFALGGSAALAASAELPLGSRLGLWGRLSARASVLREDRDTLHVQPGLQLLLGATWGR